MRYWNLFVNVCYPFHFAKNKCTYLNTSKTIRRYVHQLIVAVVACFSGCTWKFRVQTNTGEIWCHRAWPNRHRHPTHSEHGAMAGVYTVSFLVIRVCLYVPIQCIQFTCDEARSFVHLPFDDLPHYFVFNILQLVQYEAKDAAKAFNKCRWRHGF